MHPLESLSLRLVPCRASGVEVHADADVTDAVAILKDIGRWRFMMLSAQGYAVWTAIDEQRTLAQVVDLVQTDFLEIDLMTVAMLVHTMRADGFVYFAGDAVVPSAVAQPRPRIKVHWRHPLVWDIHWTGADGVLRRLYNAGGKASMSLPFMLFVLAIGMTGLALLWRSPIDPFQHVNALTLPSVFLAQIGLGILHETAHAMAVKHHGRDVGGVGVGWFWFSFSLSVDTSDMWLGSRMQRIMVSAAGPAFDFLTSGLLIITSFLIGDPVLAAWFGLLGAIGYVGLLFILCPAIDSDGYHILCEVVREQHIKKKAGAWLQRAGAAGWHPRAWFASRSDVGYASFVAGAVGYVFVSLFVIVFVGRPHTAIFFAQWLPPSTATAISIGFCILACCLATWGITRELFPRFWALRMSARAAPKRAGR